jgi:hypothetical protein
MSQFIQIFIKSIRRFFRTILESSNDIIKDIHQHKNWIRNKKFPKVRRNKKLWNSPMLKIKEVLIKLRLFKINYINLINFSKNTEGKFIGKSRPDCSQGKAVSRLHSGLSNIIGQKIGFNEKLVIDFILKKQAWFFSHIDTGNNRII